MASRACVPMLNRDYEAAPQTMMMIPEENQRSDTDRELGTPANLGWWAAMLVSLACIGVLPFFTTWRVASMAIGGVLLSVLLWIRGILGQAVRAVFITALFLAGGLLAIIAIHPQQPETSLSIMLVVLALAGIVVWRTWGTKWDLRDLLEESSRISQQSLWEQGSLQRLRYRSHRPGTAAGSSRYYRSR